MIIDFFIRECYLYMISFYDPVLTLHKANNDDKYFCSNDWWKAFYQSWNQSTISIDRWSLGYCLFKQSAGWSGTKTFWLINLKVPKSIPWVMDKNTSQPHKQNNSFIYCIKHNRSLKPAFFKLHISTLIICVEVVIWKG